MKVVTGVAKGVPLKTLEGDRVRPTSQKVKEAIFSSIQFDIEGRKVLDLFAGSGQLGIEALSRGAASATFVDASNDSLSVVRENLRRTKLEEFSIVKKSDFKSFLTGCNEIFDIIFLDPPYFADYYETATVLSAKILSKNGLLICEHPDSIVLSKSIEQLSLQKLYKSGSIRFSIYR